MSKDGTAKSYAGYLIDDRYGFLALSEVKDSEDGSSIAEMISEDWEVGDKVFVRYFIFESPLTIDEAERALINKMCGGAVDVKYVLEAYSEWTILEFEQNLKIGGHDLIAELESYIGKYALIGIIPAGQAEPLLEVKQ